MKKRKERQSRERREIRDSGGGVVVVWLVWLSGEALAAQARSRWFDDCPPFHFPLLSPHALSNNIYIYTFVS